MRAHDRLARRYGGVWGVVVTRGRGREGREGEGQDDEGVRRCQGDVKACVRRTLRSSDSES